MHLFFVDYTAASVDIETGADTDISSDDIENSMVASESNIAGTADSSSGGGAFASALLCYSWCFENQ